MNEGAASENVNLFRWNGDKTYTDKYLFKVHANGTVQSVWPHLYVCVCMYEVTGQKSKFCDKKGMVGLVAH